MTFLMHWSGIAEDLQVARYATKPAAQGAAEKLPNERSAWVIEEALDFKDVSGSIMVAIYNQWAHNPIKKFENRDAAQRRVFMALTDKFGNLPMSDFQEDTPPLAPEPAAPTIEPEAAAPEAPTNEEVPTTTMAKSKKERVFTGYPASSVADFSPMRDGVRASVLRLMDGKNTIGDIAKSVRKKEAVVRQHMYLMSTVHGVGCEVSENGKVKAVFPGSKTVKDAIKSKEE
jgi:hypothetical protein